jgi:hypothetical protein
MAMNDEGLLSFEEFRQRVGVAEYTVRRALRELGLRPIPLLRDMRQTGYKEEWVAQVRQWIDARRGADGV